MATSPYFNHHKSKPEQSLHESLVIETIKMSGLDVYYLPASRDEIDEILGESLQTSFNKVVVIEVYMPEGGVTGGEGDIMAKFGLAHKDTMTVMMSKRRFTEQVAKAKIVDLPRPREGDLIFIGDINKPLASQVNELFEITFVDATTSGWSFGKTFVYKISLAAYTYSYEKFNTNTALDGVLPDSVGELSVAINNAVQTTKQTLVRFDKKNPLSNI